MSNIKQISELAGVSTATVSRYLNNKITITPQTEARILAAIKELNYIPSGIARSLKTNRTNTVAVILPKINNLYYPEITSGINNVLESADYSMFLYETSESDGITEKVFNRIYANRVDGVIVIGYRRNEDEDGYLGKFIKAGIPVIWLNRGEGGVNIPFVSTDYNKCGTLVASYLYDKGYRKPGIVSPKLRVTGSMISMESFLGEIQQRTGQDVAMENIFFADHLTYEGHFIDDICTRARAAALDALYILDERLAVYITKELMTRGVKVPDDVAVVGYGNTFFATIVSPNLTCLDLHNVEIGETGAQLLLDRLGGNSVPWVTKLEPSLVIREST